MILAIDSSTKNVGVCIYDGNHVLYEKVWHSKRRHTVELSPAVNLALTESGLKISSLICIAVATGPGSFTSLRIGLALAKGLCLSLLLPLVGVPSLDITAYGKCKTADRMICVLKAGRNRFAAQKYLVENDQWVPEGDIFPATAEELENLITEPTIICGEINEGDRKILSRRWRNAIISNPADNVRRPAYLAEIAWHRYLNGNTNDVIQLEPIYLRTVSIPTD